MRAAGVTFAYERGPAVRDPAQVRLVDWARRRRDRLRARRSLRAERRVHARRAARSGSTSARRGIADAMCFAPLNKAALRAGGMNHADELHYFCEVLGFTGPCGRVQRAGNAVDVARDVARRR